MSKLYYAHLFCLQYTTKCTRGGTGIFVSQAQHIQGNVFSDTSIKDKYIKMNKQYINILHDIVYKLESTIYTTPGNKLTLLDVVNRKAVCRMLQISQPFTSTKTLILQLCFRPSSPFHVGKILIYAMPKLCR